MNAPFQYYGRCEKPHAPRTTQRSVALRLNQTANEDMLHNDLLISCYEAATTIGKVDEWLQRMLEHEAQQVQELTSLSTYR
ncbi:hypothetical protein RvY_03836 [Ramazzottius varieornatus]|uniref:Uncharacterized protein n=1 Tax=Ramazzottius varieornatus TaxID=947166 RepID=A0A1D1UQ91_RAMVA|nr:hypothetical protein RvY_03836 [Ramazzottius varieornatus]